MKLMKINSSLIYLVENKSEVSLINKYSDLVHNGSIIITTVNDH